MGRRSYRSMIGRILLVLLGFYFTYRVSNVLPDRLINVFYGIFSLLGLEILHRVYNSKYEITKQHAIQHTGILSLVYNKVTVNLEDIRDIKVHQTLLGRLLNFGTVTLSTAAEAYEEVAFSGIKNPKFIAEILKGLSLKPTDDIVTE